MNRRILIKGVAVAGLVGLLGTGIKHHNDHTGFIGLWNLMQEYNETRNKVLIGRRPKEDEQKALEKLFEYNKANVPGLDLGGSPEKSRNFFIEHGKVFAKFRGADGVDTITLGDIKNKLGDRDTFSWGRVDFDYKAILFEQEGKTINDFKNAPGVFAFWDEQNRTAYINLSKIVK